MHHAYDQCVAPHITKHTVVLQDFLQEQTKIVHHDKTSALLYQEQGHISPIVVVMHRYTAIQGHDNRINRYA